MVLERDSNYNAIISICQLMFMGLQSSSGNLQFITAAAAAHYYQIITHRSRLITMITLNTNSKLSAYHRI